MRTHVKQPTTSHTIQSKTKAANQASLKEVLQAYNRPTLQAKTIDEDDLLQGKFESIQREELPDEEELLQGKFETVQGVAMDEDELLQGKFDTIQRGKDAALPIANPSFPNRTGLPDHLKSGIENLSGYSMDDVRVHYNSPKPAQLQAFAYTQGTDIHVAPGQEKHLPHESWHVVQQKQGRVQPTMQLQGVKVNDNEGLEKEADVMGGRAMQRKGILQGYKSLNRTGVINGVQQFVLTRSMWKIINETEFTSAEDIQNMILFLKKRGYGADIVNEIIERICYKTKYQIDADVFGSWIGERQDMIYDSDEEDMNYYDHGDLAEYDDPNAIDHYLGYEYGITQLARKGNTISGPKDYPTVNYGGFKQVAYTTDGKGAIDFACPTGKHAWTNPVLPGSQIDLATAGKKIDKKSRPQHFALADALYAKKSGVGKASYATNFRKSKYTWHHLPTAYNMVLVDMIVHAKHGHNGGVYLW